jgi:hypothetical protein
MQSPFSIHPRLFISLIPQLRGPWAFPGAPCEHQDCFVITNPFLWPLLCLGKKASARRSPRLFLRPQTRIDVRLNRLRPEWGISQERPPFSPNNRSRFPREPQNIKRTGTKFGVAKNRLNQNIHFLQKPF